MAAAISTATLVQARRVSRVTSFLWKGRSWVMGLWISLVISVRIRIRYRSILYLFMNHKHISVTIVIYIPFFFRWIGGSPYYHWRSWSKLDGPPSAGHWMISLLVQDSNGREPIYRWFLHISPTKRTFYLGFSIATFDYLIIYEQQ